MGAPTGANGSCCRDPTRAPRRAPRPSNGSSKVVSNGSFIVRNY